MLCFAPNFRAAKRPLVIEIPGYKILRQLGRGGMATVYLAMQESVQREVALKVMSPSLLADPDFGERFLREARIAAKLHHRNVVGVHDVGRAGEYHYIAMEYLGGGAVLAKDGTPRPVGFALRVTREIATALNYAHAKGFVHRDVKPDNILLREDGSAALTDFGIARASDSATHMTRTGTVIGTPHYMSPEQARGRPLDGRADLYSLGIVLYELLTGRVPFHADDSLAVGIMHITQPIPILPERLYALQPVLNRLLAKQPDDRFQDGAAVADAIEQIELAIARGEHPELADSTIRRDAGADAGTRVITPTPAGGARHRAEPSLGRLDDIANAPMHRPQSSRSAAPPTRSRRWIFAVIAAVVIATLALWFFQNRLRGLLPNTELNTLIARGDKALAEDKLVGNHNDSARELFQAARTLDPDNEAARAGLNKVGGRLIEQARAALTRNDFSTAQSDLDQANEVLGGGKEVEDLKSALHSAQTRNTASAALIEKADAALAAGKLVGSGSAAETYLRVLDADATNAVALNGLKKVAEAVAQQARDAIAANNVDVANQLIAELAQLSPNHPAIPELRGAIAKLHAGTQQVLEDTLTKAEAQQRAGRIAGADGALALFQSALKSAPANARAKNGMARIAQILIAQANAALDDDNTTQAAALLQQAAQAMADSPALRKANSRLADARERLDAAKHKAQLTPADVARVQQMLGQADQAMASGNLILPPGDCAFDKYRAVLAIDSDNAAAMAGLAKIPARARELFEQAIRNGTPNRARAYIDAVSQSDPDDASVPAMRNRLADVFLDQTQGFIAQKRRADAGHALDAARELNPNNPRLAALRAQLESMPAD
ncbi:MAG: serine/threonine protein kinase [Xanthomonadales bacterium PRO7]|nr:serine/threonine protein kinase [Xanthomonadales bacterium PRO7]